MQPAERGRERREGPKEKPFPIGQRAIDTTTALIIKLHGSNLGDFADKEKEVVSQHDPNLISFLDLSFGRFQDLVPDAERNAFDDGAMLVNRIFKEQAKSTGIPLPTFDEEINDALAKETREWEIFASRLNTTSSNLVEIALERIKYLIAANDDPILGRALLQTYLGHPVKESFLVGAMASYFPRKEAWQESHLEEDFEAEFGGSS